MNASPTLPEDAWEVVERMGSGPYMLDRREDGSGVIRPIFGKPLEVSAAVAAVLERHGFIVAYHREKPVGPWNLTFHARDALVARLGLPDVGRPRAALTR